MKTISIEMQDNVYETFLKFLDLLPKNEFKIYDDTDIITQQERDDVHRYNTMIDKGDLSEFSDFKEFKHALHS